MNEEYNYDLFIKEAKDLCEKTKNIFKIMEVQSLIKINYIKGNLNIGDDSYILECNIIFSEVFNLPVMYFIIYDENGMITKFEEFNKKFPTINNEFINFCEISKENFPYGGGVYEYMHLCKFNQLLKKLPNINNKLIFCLSVILQMFNINFVKYFNFN